MSPWLKIVLEIGPLAVFFILFNQAKDPDGDAAQVDALIFATVGFIAALLASIAVTYALTRTVSRMLMATTVVVIVLGGLTVWLRDETFIKMRPTLVNGAFALLLGIGLLQGRSYLKTVIGDLLPMRDEGWMKLTRNWACYFAFMACLNEAVWRNVSTETWVDVKTFVYLPLALVFTLSQSGLIAKYQIEEKAKA